MLHLEHEITLTQRKIPQWCGLKDVASYRDVPSDAVDLNAKIISDTIARIWAHSATITDPVEQAEFNRGAAKIIDELESKLLALQTPFDEVQTARKLLKTQIDDAGQVS